MNSRTNRHHNMKMNINSFIGQCNMSKNLDKFAQFYAISHILDNSNSIGRDFCPHSPSIEFIKFQECKTMLVCCYVNMVTRNSMELVRCYRENCVCWICRQYSQRLQKYFIEFIRWVLLIYIFRGIFFFVIQLIYQNIFTKWNCVVARVVGFVGHHIPWMLSIA